jgi:hypothetical protein
MTFKNHLDDLKVMGFSLDRMREILEVGGAQKTLGGGQSYPQPAFNPASAGRKPRREP